MYHFTQAWCVCSYIEDLEESCVGRVAKMNSLRKVLPPRMCREKGIGELIAAEYARICGLTLRDAKHLYVHVPCTLVSATTGRCVYDLLFQHRTLS
jgi:hypothetical protein